jgi:uncharacterized protein DUF4150/HNH/endonuclease VII toxin of polymorphic toxin system
MEISSKSMGGKSICQFPDVCFTPPQTPATPPGVPIPYPNTGMAGDTTDGSSSVKIGNETVMLKDRSSFKQSSGDEAGCAPKKGLINSKNKGKVFFAAWSMDVKIEGENVVRNLDMTTHNHASPPNGAAPMVHQAAMSLAKFDNCKKEADEIEKKCGGEKPPKPCPGALGMTIKKGGASSATGKIKDAFRKRGLSEDQIKAKNPYTRLSKASAVVAENSDCVKAMRCLLRPYEAEKDGVSGCCPGQTPHHIPPDSVTQGLGLSKGKKLCVCLEGTNHSMGTHGKHHHGINFLMEGAAKSGAMTKSVQGGDTMFTGPVSEHIKVSAAVTEAQNGCSKECIEEQLNKSFGDKTKEVRSHNASTTGGTDHALMNDEDKAAASSALARAPSIA